MHKIIHEYKQVLNVVGRKSLLTETGSGMVLQALQLNSSASLTDLTFNLEITRWTFHLVSLKKLYLKMLHSGNRVILSPRETINIDETKNAYRELSSSNWGHWVANGLDRYLSWYLCWPNSQPTPTGSNRHPKSLSLSIFINNLLPVSRPKSNIISIWFLGDTGFTGWTEYSSAQTKGF